MTMESWRHVWRKGVAPVLSTHGLVALRQAVAADDRRLLQMTTTSPAPLECVADWPVEGACAIGFCGWQAEGRETVSEVNHYFAEVCQKSDELLKEPAMIRWWLNWWDDTPRKLVLQEMLPEIDLELERRQQESANKPLQARSA